MYCEIKSVRPPGPGLKDHISAKKKNTSNHCKIEIRYTDTDTCLYDLSARFYCLAYLQMNCCSL